MTGEKTPPVLSRTDRKRAPVPSAVGPSSSSSGRPGSWALLLALAALLLSGAAHAQDGTGRAGALDEPQQSERSVMRLRASLGAVAAVGWVPIRSEVQFAPGLTGEVGGVFGDRTSLSARFTIAPFGLGSVLELHASVGFALGERLWAGVGLGAQYLGALTAFNAQWVAVVVPLRFEYVFSNRAAKDVRRTGAFGFAQFAPGFLVAFGGQMFPSMSGMVGAGWAWW